MRQAGLRPSLTPAYAVSVTEGIQYGEGQVTRNGVVSTTPLYLDLYQPAPAPEGPRATILIVHGGAFLRGSRREANLVKAATAYAARGYRVASISYRLGGGPELVTTGKVGSLPVPSARVQAYAALVNGVDSLRFLDFLKDPTLIATTSTLARLGQITALDDTLTAMDWLTSQAAPYALDLSRLVLFGGSAGFINALHVAYALDDLGIHASPVAAVLGFWGAFNLDDDDVADDGPAFLEAGEAPLFVVHGTSDVEVPISYGAALVARANQIGLPVEFIPVAGGKHGFASIDIFTMPTDNGQSIFERSLAFLDRMLFG